MYLYYRVDYSFSVLSCKPNKLFWGKDVKISMMPVINVQRTEIHSKGYITQLFLYQSRNG